MSQHCEMSHKRNWSFSTEEAHILLEQDKLPESDYTDNEYAEKEDDGRRRSSIPVHSDGRAVPIPKTSALKVFLHSPSVSHSFPKPDFNMGLSPSDHQVLSNHLREEPEQTFGSVSHSILGGETTRDIYYWKEKKERRGSIRKRTNSEPNLVLIDENEEPVVYASELRQPGVFRRFFMAKKAQR